MIPEFTDQPLYSAWPFWVLELTPEASAIDIERQARELVNKLKFKLPGVEYYLSPLGKKTRDEYLIREAKSKLQDPKDRLLAEFWHSDLSTEIKTEAIAHTDNEVLAYMGLTFWEA